jgi:small metal-binding protein
MKKLTTSIAAFLLLLSVSVFAEEHADAALTHAKEAVTHGKARGASGALFPKSA